MESIHFSDETYRISEVLVAAPLQASLEAVGQLHPVLLLGREDSGKIIVCGFRRLHALRRLGRRRALARVIPETDCGSLEAFHFGLWDNLSHRQLEPLEQARALCTLHKTCGVSRARLVESYLPLMGLAPHGSVLENLLSLHALPADLKKLLVEGRLTLATCGRLAGMTREDQTGMGQFFLKARLSASLQRRFLDLVEELGAIGDCSVSRVLLGPETATILDDPALTPFQRGERAFASLYRQRYPRLCAAEDRFHRERKKLGLPGSIKLTHESFFETPGLHVEFDAPSATCFRQIAQALQRAAQAAALDDLYNTT